MQRVQKGVTQEDVALAIGIDEAVPCFSTNAGEVAYYLRAIID